MTDKSETLYYLYLSDTPQHPTRRTHARAPSKDRALELVYQNLPNARVYKIGLLTDTEEAGEEEAGEGAATKDDVLESCYLHDEIKDWREFLEVGEDKKESDLIRKHSATGRPLGNKDFLKDLS